MSVLQDNYSSLSPLVVPSANTVFLNVAPPPGLAGTVFFLFFFFPPLGSPPSVESNLKEESRVAVSQEGPPQKLFFCLGPFPFSWPACFLPVRGSLPGNVPLPSPFLTL